MELPTQQALGQTNNTTGMGADEAEPASIAPVAEPGATTTEAADLLEGGGAKGEILRNPAAAVQREDIPGVLVPPSVQGVAAVDAVSLKAPGVAAGGDVSRERTKDELRPAEGGMRDDAVVEVERKEGSGEVTASAAAASRPGDIAGGRSCGDAGKGVGAEGEGEGAEKPQQKAAAAVSVSGAMLQPAEAALSRLFDTHDNFFSSDKDEKQRRLEAQAEEVVKALAGVGDVRDIRQRARVCYIRGRALDVFSEFNPEAEKCLAKAVKLHPAEPDGWNALGHCYWKKPDLMAARRCYHQALDKGRKPESLRQLSMLLRQLPGTAEETSDYLQESLRLAKEAVALDMGSGTSWYVLGNAYVASFFRNSRGVKDLDRALQAYKKAESNGGGGNPDLFFNRAHVFHYREDYPEAVRDYRLARELDPSLPVDQALHSIETGVERLAKLVEKKGGLKAKRLSQLVASLGGNSARKGLGDAHRLVGLRDLMLGGNRGVALALKVVFPAGQNSQPPERFVVVDGNGEFAVLSLYSISKEACERIRSKDTLLVKNPSLRTICLGSRTSPAPTTPPATGATQRVTDVGRTDAGAGHNDNDIGDKPALSTIDTAGSGSTENISGGSSNEVLAASCRGVRLGGGLSLPPSYPGIQADPTEMLLNGEAMKASFAAPDVRLANFDK